MRGKPLDGSKNPGGRPPKYPWRTLKVGQSFLAPERFTHTQEFANRYWQARQQALNEGADRQFAGRAVMLNGKRRIRVYRVR